MAAALIVTANGFTTELADKLISKFARMLSAVTFVLFTMVANFAIELAWVDRAIDNQLAGDIQQEHDECEEPHDLYTPRNVVHELPRHPVWSQLSWCLSVTRWCGRKAASRSRSGQGCVLHFIFRLGLGALPLQRLDAIAATSDSTHALHLLYKAPDERHHLCKCHWASIGWQRLVKVLVSLRVIVIPGLQAGTTGLRKRPDNCAKEGVFLSLCCRHIRKRPPVLDLVLDVRHLADLQLSAKRSDPPVSLAGG
mmetsp:Transcript_123766/g.309396  ORF Transcript_123766/g.309396 Transcript_123766/m.309396 type:complete len:253 (-) Transcript_123766:1511-2269(-)